MGKQRRVSASYDDEFDNLVAKLRDDKEFANKYISEKGVKLENHFVQENFSNSKNNDYLDGNEDPHNFRGGLNLNNQDPFNDLRADRQSSLEHLGIGLLRTAAKATTEIAKLPGVIGGIGIMAADGLTGGNLVAENEGFETAFNNQWIKFFDGLNEDVKEALPVYVKESVANGDFFDKIGSSAFYATEGADGAGYMLGALAPGGLFKYFGGAAKMFGASIKAAKLAKYGKGIEAGRKAIKAANITINNIDSYMIPAFNTIAEAGAESKGAWDAMESRKGEAHVEYMSKLKPNDPRYLQAISLKNEELDQLRRSGEISIDEYNQQSANIHNVVAEEMFEKDFKEQKALAAQNTFFKNTVILAGPNYIQAKLLFGKTPSKVLLDKISGLGEKSIKNTVKQGGKNFVKGFLPEAAEEVSQTSVEGRNVEEGLKFKLGDNRIDDYNPLTFGEDFIKTLGTTEGQIAGFLGGIMGAPVSTVSGYFQDKSDRKQTERLREKIKGASTAYADIKNTNIYEQEEYTNPETGEVDFRDKEVDGKKVFIPENVAKVKKALDLIEKDSNEYDNAVEDGDIEKIEQFRNRGEFNVIANFIGEDEVTLDALHEHLKVAFPTETSKDISDEQVKVNKTNLERIDKIMSKAKSLQKDFVSFKDMSASILRINHPDITKDSTKEEKKAANEHLEDFLNRVGNTFLSERAEEYEAKQVLNKLEKQRLELENNSLIIEIDNPNYIEGFSSELDKKTKTRSNNPRLELVNSLIDKVKEQLKGYEENTNSNIWNNELLNKQFTEEVKEINNIKKENTPEQVAKNDEVLDKTKNATTVDEVKEIEKTSPKEVLENPIIKKAIADKKAEIIKAEEVANAEEIATATQEDNDFNDTTVYTGLTGTEGSPVTDDLIPKEAENNTVEERNAIKNEEVLTGKGAQVISTNMKTGELFNFVSEDYLNYERNPINKAGKEVGFEINTNPGPNENLNIALKMLEGKDFSNPAFLISYLPINVTFEKGIKAPMETRRANGKLDSKKDKDGKDQFYINPATEILRSQIINHLVNGGSINDIKTTIQDQYKGLLKVDDNRFANNNILELDGVKDLKYVRDNLYVVDSFGNLMNIQSGKTKTFSNGKTKKNAAGEIYLSIPQANGKPFPLKLNIKKINESEAFLLYEIYKEIITNDNTLDTTVSEVNGDLQEAILKSFEAELNIIGGNKNDIKLQEIVDLLIYQSDNIKSRMQIENGVLYFGENEANINNIEDSQNAIINFLVDSKRHQIKINPKFATDNTKTNLKSNSADYLKYLVDNNILSTNAVVNEPTFQGYTNIYLNTGITVTNQPKTIEKVNDDVFNTVKKYRISEAPVISFSDIDLEKSQLDEDSFGTEINKVVLLDNRGENQNGQIVGTVQIWGGSQEEGDLWNEKYEVFLKPQEQPKVSESGVEVKTDNTGFDEMFNTSEMGDDVLDILKEFETEPKVEDKSDIEAKKAEINFINENAFVHGTDDGYRVGDTREHTRNYAKDIRQLVGSNGELGEKKNITQTSKDGKNIYNATVRLKDINRGAGVGFLSVSVALPVTSIINEKEIYDILNDKLNQAVLQVTDTKSFLKTTNTNYKSISKIEFSKNKSENTRNVQENFVSLSEIKGTVENTQLNETQAEVFNENRKPLSATEQRLINKAISVYQEDASKLTEAQKKRLEEYATNYPESWKKICK